MNQTTKRKCRKCNGKIPSTIKINGKTHNLCSRKFCLTCSPFGSHNTKPDDPARESVHKHIPYSQWTEERKHKFMLLTAERGHILKARLVELKGGCCQQCGYDKCLQALCFHHIDPNTKLFQLDTRTIRAKKWSIVLQELVKCQLLCMNCHHELHNMQ